MGEGGVGDEGADQRDEVSRKLRKFSAKFFQQKHVSVIIINSNNASITSSGGGINTGNRTSSSSTRLSGSCSARDSNRITATRSARVAHIGSNNLQGKEIGVFEAMVVKKPPLSVRLRLRLHPRGSVTHPQPRYNFRLKLQGFHRRRHHTR